MRAAILFLLLVSTVRSIAQAPPSSPGYKGRAFVYWGWNRAWYTASDLHLKGDGFDFILKDIVAQDRPTDYNTKVYFNPSSAPIPQYNFRMGYFLKENYSISFGLDHMKYVMVQDQTARIDGAISATETGYNGNYANDDILVSEELLTFEHTDGLNYANLELRRFDEVWAWKKVKVALTEGIGAGVLVPKTNARVLDNERNDEFHLSGYGIGAVAGLNVEFFSSFFVQTEFKGGYINMPDILITQNDADRADQQFFFAQWNWEIGASFRLVKPKN
jgi:hypothetical protein